MAVFNKFQQFVEDKNHGVHNLGSDTLKFVLSNVGPTAGLATFSQITEITAGNGYTAGGETLTVSSSGQTTGTYSLVVVDDSVTASGGSIGPFQYVVYYNDTPTSPTDPLIGWVDYGSPITLADGEPFNLDHNATAFMTDV